MLKQIEGSHAMAEAIALCRPEVICAYPITPQTHIVEGLGDLVKEGALTNCEFINVESEFAALSVAIGASAAGARAYTATASQGLLFMAEAVYNASGLGLPIVMTLGNRAIGAPINIWNDHSDAMSMRDAGWLQLFAETNQEAVDLHIQAFRLAEELSMPVMVCVDGFILTHAMERIDIPTQEQVDAYLPPYDPVQVLDPAEPASIGAIGRAGSVHGSALPRPLQAEPGAEAHSGIFDRIRESLRPRNRRAAAQLPRRGRRHAGGRDGLGVRYHQGHHRRDARRWHPHRPRRNRFVPPLPGGGAASCARRRQRRRGGGKEHRGRHGRAALQRRRRFPAQSAAAAAAAFLCRRPRRPADHPRLAASFVPAGQRAALGRHQFPRPERTRRRPRDPSHPQDRHSGPTAENILRELAKSVPPAAE